MSVLEFVVGWMVLMAIINVALWIGKKEYAALKRLKDKIL